MMATFLFILAMSFVGLMSGLYCGEARKLVPGGVLMKDMLGMMSKARSEACLTPRKLRDLLERTTTNEELFTISSSTIHLRGVYSRMKGGENP